MACTIGVVLTKASKVIVFKNRDLSIYKNNPEPLIESGVKTRYIKFGVSTDNSIPGVWAGINDKGVAIVGADGNSLQNFEGPDYGGGEKTWEAYEHVLADTTSLDEAISLILNFYSAHKIGGTGDIIIIADSKRAAILEYTLNLWGIQFIDGQSYGVRTNFFNILKHLRPSPEENTLHLSSARRYERTIELLSKTGTNTTVSDIKELCRDHYYEPSAFSICRHGGDGEYRTLCSAIMETGEDGILAHYIMNEYPCQVKYNTLKLS